ncbi:MAG: hypothetical protein WA971_14040, partial [Microbacterium sp.]
VAGSVWGVSWGLALAAVLMPVVAGLGRTPLPGVFLSRAPDQLLASFATIGVTVAFVYGPVSALLLARRAHPVGTMLAVHALGSALAAFGVQWGLLGAAHPGLPLWGLLAFAAGWAYVPGTILTAVLPILVTRRRIPRWQRGLFWSGVAVAGVTTLVCLIQQGAPAASPARNPLALPIPAVQELLPGAYLLCTVVAVTISAVTCGILVQRWTVSRGRVRTGMAWLALGHAFLTASYAVLVMPASVPLPGWLQEIGLIAPAVGQVLYSAAILVVVLGQRLWGVELVVSRVVLWVLLSIGGVAIYLLVVLAVPRLLPGAAQVRAELWIAVPLIVAVAATPLRTWPQRRIDRLIYGEGAEPASALRRLGALIDELDGGEAGLQRLSAALRSVLRLGEVTIRSHRTGLSATAGSAGTEPISVPLHGRTGPIGELVVHPPDGQRLDRRTLGVLGDVAGLVAAALRLIETHIELDGMRARLVAERAAERRRIQRELHDGLGPALAGIGFGLA